MTEALAPIKPYTFKELYSMYGVTRKTFNTWLKRWARLIGPRNGLTYTQAQVEVIFDKLGRPYITIGKP